MCYVFNFFSCRRSGLIASTHYSLSSSAVAFIGGFITTNTTWRWAFGSYSIWNGLCLFATALWAEETYYNRKIPYDPAVRVDHGPRWSRMLGIPQWKTRHQRITLYEAVARPCRTLAKPVIALACIFNFLVYAWVSSTNRSYRCLAVSDDILVSHLGVGCWNK